MGGHKRTLTIVIPCFNPASGWEVSLVERINLIISNFSNLDISTVIVNDGSSRGVPKSAISYIQDNVSNITYLKHKLNKGKGAAVRTGISHKESDFYLYSDVDLPYTQDSIHAIIQALEQGAEMAVAVKDAAYYSDVPFARKLISKTLRAMIQLALGIPNSDTQCGLKGMSKLGKSYLLKTTIDSYLFDLQWIVLAEKNKVPSIHYLPSTLREGVVFSNVSLRMMINEAFNFAHILFTR